MNFRNFKNQLSQGFGIGLSTDLVRGLYFVFIFAIAFLLFSSFTSVKAQKQLQPPLERGQRVEVMVDMKDGGMTSIVGVVVGVNSVEVTLNIVKGPVQNTGMRIRRVGNLIWIPLSDIQSYRVLKRKATQENIGLFFGIGIFIVLCGVIFWIVFLRGTSEQRRKIREENLRDPKKMALIGGMVGFIVSIVLIIVINLLFDMVLDKWGVVIRGGAAAVPLSFVLSFLCIWFFARLFHARAKSRHDIR